MIVCFAHFGSIVPNTTADVLNEVSRVDTHGLPIVEGGDPAKTRRLVSRLQQQLIGFASTETLPCVGSIQPELFVAHAQARVSVIPHFVQALHYADGVSEGRRVVVDAQQRLVSLAAVLTELAPEGRRVSRDDRRLSKDVHANINEVEQLGMERQELEFVGNEAVAVSADGFDVDIDREPILWRTLHGKQSRVSYLGNTVHAGKEEEGEKEQWHGKTDNGQAIDGGSFSCVRL